MTTALITNDDGIDSPGLVALAQAAVRSGLEVIVAAPASQSSGSSASIMAQHDDGRIHFEERAIDGLPDSRCYAVEAAPALIALLAAHGAFTTTPELVLSGINRGANAGRAILHSGTVGAALTAGVNDARGLAVSLDVGIDPDELHWETAAALVEQVVPVVLAQQVGAVVNLNVPNLARVPELREAHLSEFGIVQTTITEPFEGDLRLAVADPGESVDPESDTALLRAGYATLTSITSVGWTPLRQRE
ncbi:5'/3'-nucleotidase SurE [Herbiconiux sp. L3-i23]|uniref:5'/3'-nucleotidase SurE n=1 Tax=Herbiconiux sp. L3-i23 TaxID=2905871 RepID=UPI00205208D5|nr:5'/3'-nucleotidase SurE [Herbiconiux sp. L3-i23]BDI23352.1 5'/3'-nucleotidase SurE [Herbiconiux sp. L3-i23]